MRRSLLAAMLAATVLAPPPPAEAAHVLWVYARDAADFLKRHHAAASRRPGNQVARKLAAMSDSPVGFFRGGAPLFYRDLTEHPALKSPVAIPLMGDLHLENLSAYRTADGRFAFDFDDFDEAFTGPYTWELARGAVSARLHAKAAGLPEAAWDRMPRRFVATYLGRLAAFSSAPKAITAPLTADRVPGPAAEAIADARKANPAKFLARWAAGGRLKPGKHVLPADPATARGLGLALEKYARGRKEPAGYFKVKDAARRVAGLASLSRMRYLVLVEGPSARDGDDVLLDLKEEGPPAAAPWIPAPAGSQADRVRKAWTYFVPDGDPFVGVAPGGGGDFLVRRLTPWRGEVDVEDLETETRFGAYVDTVALATARAHARSGKAGAILKDAGGVSKIVTRIGEFAASYAQQVEADREILQCYVKI
jgi:hypothetical protein